jgi:predicted AlkP superfamily pyrophosphatase or phosphodiesterase
MNNFTIQKVILLYIILVVPSHIQSLTSPKVTIIIVIDQLAYDSLQMVTPYLKYGLKKLLLEGVVCTNAHHPHGMPATCTGHTAISTGSYGTEHGIVGNSWYDGEGNLTACDTATTQDAAVFAPDGIYDYGKSPHYIMVDGISDQFMLCSTPTKPHHAYAISLKSRAAIATANRMGIALWFDTQSGMFTSSRAYVQELPVWLKAFNNTYQVSSPGSVYWRALYPDNAEAYRFIDSNNYRYVQGHTSLVNSSIPIGPHLDVTNQYEQFMLTPQANKLVFDCASSCITAHVHKDKPDHLLLWVCVSSLDKVGHQFGPHSKEAIDMLYHLDLQIQHFFEHVEALIDPTHVLYIVTSDHGISPIVEQLHDRGLSLGRRINGKELVQELNAYLDQRHHYTHLIIGTKGHQLYLDTKILHGMSKKKRDTIISDLQEVLASYDGIKKAWTDHELLSINAPVYSAEYYFRQQLFPGRSGTLIMQVYPYTIIGSHTYGTSHKTPYTHNTHVPLIWYQQGTIQKKQIHKKVLTVQIAPTLAHILGIPQPSAATSDILPGIL